MAAQAKTTTLFWKERSFPKQGGSLEGAVQGRSVIYYVTESAQNTPHATGESGAYVGDARLHVCAILMKEAESSVPWEERKESFFFFFFFFRF